MPLGQVLPTVQRLPPVYPTSVAVGMSRYMKGNVVLLSARMTKYPEAWPLPKLSNVLTVKESGLDMVKLNELTDPAVVSMTTSPLSVDPLWVTPVATKVTMLACMAGANRQRAAKQCVANRAWDMSAPPRY